MIGIHSIAHYLPSRQESNFDLKEQFCIDDTFINEKIGVHQKARKSEDEETSDMCVEAFNNLVSKIQLDSSEIDFILVCTQNPDGNGLPHTSSIVHHKLGCGDDVAAFDVSLGCSGYIYGLSIAISFMQANSLQKGLLFTADPYSKVLDSNDKNTTLLFGDAATVTLLTDDPKLTLEKCLFGTRGKEGTAIQVQDNKLSMNGRAVFNFSLTTVPGHINQILSETGYTINDIDLFLLHQGSKFMVEQIIRRAKLPSNKAPINLSAVGNTVSSSIPLLLEKYVDQVEISRILACGFGVGLSWATAILTNNKIS